MLVPAGGLANRMKAIAAALRLQKATGSTLCVKWFRDWGLGCRFDQLFQPIPNINNVEFTLQEAQPLDLLLYDRPRRRNFFIPRLPEALLFQKWMDEAATASGMRSGFDFASWAQGSCVWMSSHLYFMAESIPDDAFGVFLPTEKLQRRIDDVVGQLGPDAMGVHIRRTDNVRSIAESPTEAFIDRMREEPFSTLFYVATDDEGVKAQLRQEFPGRIVTLPRKAERGSLQGMEDAVVEMFVLSRCRRLIGSSSSTYSMTAAAIGRVPLETITRK